MNLQLTSATWIHISNLDSQQYDFHLIEAATDNFSMDNCIGRGGFGEVYEGMLPDGQEIAVKRLGSTSNNSKRDENFKNEVEIHAKLQHKNLVRLLGFSIRDEEKILIFEYMPNRSLSGILFDPANKKHLDWAKRYKIIKGIARGIHYIHNESRLRIIYRDLKPSNILLDSDMNPKISDFGLTLFFTSNQTQDTARCIIGTFGYMAPEYLKHKVFSVKYDVYSFGILLINIISGMDIISLHQMEGVSFMSHAWKLWNDGEAFKLVDPTIRECCNPIEVMRCIHIALLCIEHDPELRPSMSSVVLMLETYPMTLPIPSCPAEFPNLVKTMDTDTMSVNEMSISETLSR